MSALVLSGCTSGGAVTGTPTPSVSGSAGAAVLGQDTVGPLVSALTTRSVAAKPSMRLADGLVPPTNKWFSGLVFGDQPSPVFPFPLSFEETSTGFAAGLPVATSTANTVFGQAVNQVSLDVGASAAVVSRYDAVSVTIEHRAGSRVLGHTTIAEGSPLVSYIAAVAGKATLNAPVSADGLMTVGGQVWGVAVSGGTVSGASVTLKKGGSVILLPVPSGASDAQTAALLKAAASPLTEVTTSYEATGKGQRTTLGYQTASRSTLVVPLPHQGESAAASGCTGLEYKTIYGTVPVCDAAEIAFTTPTVTAKSSLDLGGLSGSEKTELKKQLVADVASSPDFPSDTYYGGKGLYRSAMLLQLARSLGDTASASTLTARLTSALDRWTEPGGCAIRDEQCFVYDPNLKTVVGLANSFGSEVDNDHHFHYGYFLYAAGVVAQSSPSLAAKWAPVMNLLAADIATGLPSAGSGSGSASSSAGGASFPALRAYDPYFSHSWASGYSIFADGNNQESSSEAVNAWAGLSFWAAASGDAPLASEAAWLLSGETASALAYYIDPDLSDSQFSGYRHDLVSLNWGGKRDFGTWFSAEPSAVVGIQLIPMSPVSTYLASPAGGGAEHIRALSKAALAKGTQVTLSDYVLMYSSLGGTAAAEAALAKARALPSTSIDDGDSRSYLLAYIMVQAAR